MGNEKIYKGNCFCGEVQFEVSGQPAAMGTVIANPAATGLQDRSTRLRYGSRMR